MTTTFASLGVPEPIVAALDRRGITAPFPIQVATIADALAGRDLCGKAPTGSGKTIAFGIPMVSRVTHSAPKKPHGLVLAPTRELAIQVAEELGALGTDLRVLAVYGGAGIEPQIKRLRAGVDIVVATPGRLIDLLDRRVCDLRSVTFAVVDEADRMADMGFLPDVKRILDETRDDRQTVLFSATLDGAIDQLVKRYQRNPVVHELHEDPAGDITHHFWLSDRPERVALLAQIIDRLGHTVVFCRTKHGSDRVARQLGNAGVKAVAIHGNRSQAQRERALEAFHRGDVQALVATDVAARGIHVEGVLGVVHFDLPGDPKDYIHRSGRTGRAGMPGTVVTLIDASQRKDAVKLKKGAGVDAEITEPDVASLPEGPQQAFRKPRKATKVRDLAPETRSARSGSGSGAGGRGSRSAGGPGAVAGSGSGSGSSRTGRTDRPSNPRGGRDPQGRTSERSTRPVRSDRSERPERSERQVQWDDERTAGNTSRQNRAVRRQSQFTDEERARRAAENEAAEQRKAKQRAASKGQSKGGSASRGPRDGRSDRTAQDRTLPADTPGSAKVRPSGASRRKARREQLAAAGEPVPAAKKRRSGAPRPPASAKRSSSR
jgi:superfamily II DNA/RNA helicase